METPPRAAAPLDAYLQRYERQQQERRRQRLQRRAQSPEAVEEELSGFLSDVRQEMEDRRANDVLSERYEVAAGFPQDQEASYAPWGDEALQSKQADDDLDLPPLDGIPADPFRSAEEEFVGDDGHSGAERHAEDEFVDAATYLAKNELDSFTKGNERAGFDWQSENESGRPSEFFKRKSRSLEHVEFSSSERYDAQERGELGTAGRTKNAKQDPKQEKRRAARECIPFTSTDRLSESQGTAVSSSNDLHFDSTRLAYTPNSLKHLQDKQRFRQAAASRQTSESVDSIADYAGEALRISENANFSRVKTKGVDESDTPSEGTMSALRRGPTVIRNALDEIDALLDRSRRRSNPPPKERGNVMTPRDFQELVREYDLTQDTGLPMSRTTDSWGDEVSDEMARPVGSPNNELRPDYPDSIARELDTIREASSSHDEAIPAPDTHSVHYEIRDESFYHPSDREEPEDDEDIADEVTDLVSDLQLTPRKLIKSRPNPTPVKSEVGVGAHGGNARGSKKIVDTLHRKDVRVVLDPVQMSRRCRRILCDVGDVVTEQIIFSNSTNSMGRLCVSLLPLSMGCQQFSVAPAVLELAPQSSGAFHVTFNAQRGGVAAGIFQFRGVGVESLFRPYEVLMEASVRQVYELEDHTRASAAEANQALRKHSKNSLRHVEELRNSVSVKDVDIGPTFIQFERKNVANGKLVLKQSKIRIVNNTAEALPFKVKCAHENLRVSPTLGMLPPASEAFVTILPISQPFQKSSDDESTASFRSTMNEKWCGSLSIQVGKLHAREVSVVVDAPLLALLPSFDEIARSRHQISSQTDSFYYTKRRNRRGLYFHARAVECGNCMVGDWHEVPVYVCNGSNRPMTVFMQELQEPFSCAYTTTTIQPRKFIEVPVRFAPKVVGKVATSLFAYSVDQKAVVTLVARGI